MLAVVATSRGMAQLSLFAWCGFGLMAMATGLLYLLPAPTRWSPSPLVAGLPSGPPSGVARPLRPTSEIVARSTPAGREARPAVDDGRREREPLPDPGRWLPAELVHADGFLSSDILDGLVQLEALANGANPSQPTG
jgi:hypothetical protein